MRYQGLNEAERITNEFVINGNNIKEKILNPRIKIPNNLFETERKIVYKGRKYHSGTICAGVTKGFAKIKLSV